MVQTLRVTPSTVEGTVRVPSSKSQTLRALLFASLAKGCSSIERALASPDTAAMVAACRAMGARIDACGSGYKVEGVGGIPAFDPGTCLDVGNSGIVLRLMAAVAALGKRKVILTGDDSICHQRPMQPLLAALEQCGVATTSQPGGKAPVTICGPMRNRAVTIDGADSQPVSALLIAGAVAPGTLHLTIVNGGEWPWVELTLHWLERMSIAYERTANQVIISGGQAFAAFEYSVPADWSSIAFPVTAALIGGKGSTIEGVDFADPQGDKRYFDVLEAMGAHFTISADCLTLQPGAQLQGGHIDINPIIDALPIAAVAATQAQSTTTIYNGVVARTKESDRIRVMAEQLQVMGACVEERHDGLVIHPSALHGGDVDSYGDHRVAMALVVAALAADRPSCVRNVACIGKTFPTFVEQMRGMGARLEYE